MKYSVCATLAVVVGAATFEEIAEKVNAGKNLWSAAVPERFASPEDVQESLGGLLPGQEGYYKPENADIPSLNGLPDSFDAAEHWKDCSVIANVRDQANCGSCWAFASTASFESRSCIVTGKDVKYSPEDTAFCSNAGNGCDGGNTAWDWFQDTGVVTGGDYFDTGKGDTCYPYSLAPCAHHVPATDKYPKCPAEGGSPSCKSACTESGYSKSKESDKAHASAAYGVSGEQQIMTDLYQNGPLYVAFEVYDDFPTYKSGVYHATSSNFLGGHAVTLVGYGELDGEKYWKIKNSWNEMWGDGGHFLIKRGNNECGIEESVSAGTIPATVAAVEDCDCSCHDKQDLSFHASCTTDAPSGWAGCTCFSKFNEFHENVLEQCCPSEAVV